MELRADPRPLPDDPAVTGLIEELRDGSAEFARLWERHDVQAAPMLTKTFRHPVVGEITVDCDSLALTDRDQHLVLYSAPPGSPAPRLWRSERTGDRKPGAVMGGLGGGDFIVVMEYVVDPPKTGRSSSSAAIDGADRPAQRHLRHGYPPDCRAQTTRRSALFSFPSLAALSSTRTLFDEPRGRVHRADRIRDESGCVLRYERTFMRPLLPETS